MDQPEVPMADHSQNWREDFEKLIEAQDGVVLNLNLSGLFPLFERDPSRYRTILQMLREQTRGSLVNQPKCQGVNLHEVLDSALLMLRDRIQPGAGKPGVTILKDYGKLPQVEGNAWHLNQAFMHILSNALDALDALEPQREPRAIRISTQAMQTTAGQQVMIRIHNNGPSIAPEHLAQLYDPFFSTKPRGQGTGLGLALSYRIVVEQHRGQMTCASAPGQGSEFILRLPVGPVEAAGG